MFRRASALANAVESSETIELALQGLRRYVVDGQLCFVERCLDLFSSALIAGLDRTLAEHHSKQKGGRAGRSQASSCVDDGLAGHHQRF
jgi:hypothetical protein